MTAPGLGSIDLSINTYMKHSGFSFLSCEAERYLALDAMNISIGVCVDLSHTYTTHLKGSLRTRRYPVLLGISNQSINQSNFYRANIPSKVRLHGATAESVLISKIDETVPWHQWTVGCACFSGEKAKSKRSVFRGFLKVATETAEWTDSGRLFQRDRAQEWKALMPVLVLTPGTDKLIPLLDLCERDGSNGESIMFPESLLGSKLVLWV